MEQTVSMLMIPCMTSSPCQVERVSYPDRMLCPSSEKKKKDRKMLNKYFHIFSFRKKKSDATNNLNDMCK